MKHKSTSTLALAVPSRGLALVYVEGGAERGACSGSGLQVEPEQEVRPSSGSQYRGYHASLSLARKESTACPCCASWIRGGTTGACPTYRRLCRLCPCPPRA